LGLSPILAGVLWFILRTGRLTVLVGNRLGAPDINVSSSEPESVTTAEIDCVNSRLQLIGSQARWLMALIGPIAFAVIIARIDLHQLTVQMRSVDLWAILFSGVLVVAIILVKGIRWHALAIVYGFPIKRRTAIVINSEGMFWGGITPGKLGEFIRANRMKNVAGTSLFDGLMLCSLDRLFDFLAVAAVAVLSGSMIAPAFLKNLGAASIDSILDYFPIILVVLMVVLGILLVCVIYMRARLTQIVKTLRSYFGSNGLFIFLISCASLFIYISAVYVIASPILPAVSFSQVAFFVSLTMMAGALPVSIGNIGTRDVVAIGVLGLWGINAEVAIAVSLLMMFLFVVATLGSWGIYKVNPV